jgi:hypothetical protein
MFSMPRRNGVGTIFAPALNDGRCIRLSARCGSTLPFHVISVMMSYPVHQIVVWARLIATLWQMV